MTLDEMKRIIDSIIHAQIEIAERQDVPPPVITANAGATEAEIAVLEKHLSSLGIKLPPSYKQFLKLHNGIEGFLFSHGISLRSAGEIVAAAKLDMDKADYDPLHHFVIGSGESTGSFISFYNDEVDENDEKEVVCINPDADPIEHDNFCTFLNDYLNYFKEVIENQKAEAARQKAIAAFHANTYPFVFFGHGTGFYRKSMYCFLCFENELSVEEKNWVEAKLPDFLTENCCWDETVLFFGSDDSFPFAVFEKYHPDSEQLFAKEQTVSDEDAETSVGCAVVEDSDTGVEDSDDRVEDSDDRVEDSDTGVEDSDTGVEDSDDRVEDSDDRVEDSDDRVEDSDETNVDCDALYEDSDDFFDKLYDEQVWHAFYRELDSALGELQKSHPIVFALRELDLEYGYELDLWHDWSVWNIETKLIPYFLNYCKAHSDNTGVLKSNPFSWAVCAIIAYYNAQYPLSDKTNIRGQLVQLISAYYGAVDNNYSYPGKVLVSILQSYPKKEWTGIITSLPAPLQLSLFASQNEGLDLLRLVAGEDIYTYVQSLIAQTQKQIQARLIYRLGCKIANIEIESTDGYAGAEILQEDDSDPMLGAAVMELCFDLPEILEDAFKAVAMIYDKKNMLEKSLNVYLKAYELKMRTPNIFTGIIFTAQKLNNMAVVNKYVDLALENEELLSHPFLLSNVVYFLNQRAETGDKEAMNAALKLAKNYWRNPDSRMIATLYDRFANTFLVAQCTDEVLTEIVEESIKILSEDPDWFRPIETSIIAYIAGYYTILGNREKAFFYLKQAKERQYDSFVSLKLHKNFRQYAEDDDFKALFVNMDTSKCIDETNAQSLFQHALTLHEQGNAEAAAVYYQKVLKLNPSHIQALLNMGNIYFEKNEWDKVFYHYDKVIEINPEFMLGYACRGEANLVNKRYEAAIDDTSKAIGFDSRYDYPYWIRGCSYWAVEEFDRAKQDFIKGKELNPNYQKAHGHNPWFSVVQQALG